jgi:uncharacterized protein
MGAWITMVAMDALTALPPTRETRMPRRFAELTFTAGVRAAQARYGARAHAERYAASEAANVELGEREREFIAARDSFYLATVCETGWPYVQHRGGAPGFLRVVDATTLAFADFRGNLQYQSVGNLAGNDRICLILVDYPQRRRLKILGHVRVIDAGGELGAADREACTAALAGLQRWPAGRAEAGVERVLVIDVAAFDWNCSRYITPRFSEAELQRTADPLNRRIAELEARLLALGESP